MKTIKNLIGLWKLYKQLQKISNAGHYKVLLKIYAKNIWIGPQDPKAFYLLDETINIDL